ncbi:anthrone oxygenase family protein [Variovorax sp. RT4R15]|uniref:anthrone oxygenase family protein n=1 Tax=Variovorax sp. RT4R15 TaxID=3443737 RepID=UPI003F448196
MPRFSLGLQRGLHALAILWLGLMAGFFWAYSANVSVAMLQMDGATYAAVQSAFNRNVRHTLFFVFFFGPPLWCALALLAAWPQVRRVWWWCLAIAGVLYGLGIVVFTAQVNLPLNAYTESWNPQALPPDWAATRDAWNAANLWRTCANAVAFALAVMALALRSDGFTAMRSAHPSDS